jgi:hypothetical protein
VIRGAIIACAIFPVPMNEILEKTSWLEGVVEKLAVSGALRESDRVVAERKRWAIMVEVFLIFEDVECYLLVIDD